MSARRTCALIAIVSALLIFLWTAARVRYVYESSWSGVFCSGTKFSLPPDLAPSTYRTPGSGYDGQFYRYLAHDPFLQRGYSPYVDAPQLRFRRLLVPLLAWVLAFGQQRWVDVAYIAVEMLFVALGVYWCARLFGRRGLSLRWGLLFLAVPGTMTSYDRMLVDGPLTALFAGFVLYNEEDKPRAVWLVTMLAVLTRDTGLLLAVALVLQRLIRRDLRGALWFGSSAIPALAWWAYLAVTLPRDPPANQFNIPVFGFVQRLLLLRPYPDPRLQLLLQVTDALAVIGLVISIVLAVRWALQLPRGPVTLSVGLFATLLLFLSSQDFMTDAFGFGRPSSPLLLWLMVEAVTRRVWLALAAPLAISLSVGLMFGRDLITVVNGLVGR